MFGIGLGGAAVGASIFFYLFPLALCLLISWAVWPVTFFQLLIKSPHKRRVKWWIFMPFASLAGAVVGTLKAGMILWIPILICLKFWPASETELTTANIFYFVVAGALSSSFAAEWILRFDRQMHE